MPPDFRIRASTQFSQSQAIETDNWRRLGFNVQDSVLPDVQVDVAERFTFGGISQESDGADETGRVQDFSSDGMGTAANHWVGGNRSGYTNPDYDRLWETYRQTLDRSQRDQLIIQMNTILANDVAAYVTYPNLAVIAHVATLQGPEPESRETTAPNWNIYDWTYAN